MQTVAQNRRGFDDRSCRDEEEEGRQGQTELEQGVEKRGWRLRLLLSLEETGRTRSRLLVTEVLAGIITEIIDIIPGKVGNKQ